MDTMVKGVQKGIKYKNKRNMEILPSQNYINNPKEIDDLLHEINKAIYQKNSGDLLRLKFICNDIYGLRITSDGGLEPINQN